MSTVKTAISIQEPLFDRLDQLSTELNMSRSSLLALAFEEFLQRYENRKLLEALNKAYDDEQAEELEQAAEHLDYHVENLEDDSW